MTLSAAATHIPFNAPAARWYSTMNHAQLDAKVVQMAGNLALGRIKGGTYGIFEALSSVVTDRALAYTSAGETVDYRPMLANINNMRGMF